MQSKANINDKVLLINKLHHYVKEFEKVADYYKYRLDKCTELRQSITDHSTVLKFSDTGLDKCFLDALDLELQKFVPDITLNVQFRFQKKHRKFVLKTQKFQQLLYNVLDSELNLCGLNLEAILDETEILSDFDLAGTNFVPFK